MVVESGKDVVGFSAVTFGNGFFDPNGSKKYSPVPNIRPGPNYRPDGDRWSKLISNQDLFTDHMG